MKHATPTETPGERTPAFGMSFSRVEDTCYSSLAEKNESARMVTRHRVVGHQDSRQNHRRSAWDAYFVHEKREIPGTSRENASARDRASADHLHLARSEKRPQPWVVNFVKLVLRANLL